MAFGLFINYRTADARFGAAATYELLAARFGRERVFLDNQSMPPGSSYPASLRQALESVRVLLVLVGPQWLATDPVRPGHLLIERGDDWVRREIRRALERDIVVVPVLLDGVGRLDPGLLPDDVRSLAYLQVAEVRHRYLGADVRRLADYLVALVPELASLEVYPDRGPRQLPPGSGQLVARERALAWLDKVLLAGRGAGVPVAIVEGPPGVGKTALAVAWAHRVSSGFSDGVLYADLRGWGPDQPVAADEVLPGWLRAFGMDPTVMPDDLGGRSAMLRTALAGRRVLVVLDNARSEEQIRPLLPGSPSCSVLITSRYALPGLVIHHNAEVLALDLLTIAESVALLRGLVGQRVEREPDTAAELARLCGRLPLTLGIAAENARSRSGVSLAVLVEELADEGERLNQLGGDDPRSDPRTVLSWSYRQLPGDLARTFGLLGLLPGRAFGAHAVAALADIAPRLAARHLRSLVRAHLVWSPTTDRFEMHDLIRLYAAEIAHNPGSEETIRAARSRVFEYFLHTARRADELIVPHRYRIPLAGGTSVLPPFRDYDQALAWLDTECANLVALCGQDHPELDTLRWQLAFQLRGYFFLTKRTHEWVESHESALAAAIRSGSRLGEAMTRSNLGVALHERGDDDNALLHNEIAQRLFIEVGDPHGVSNTLVNQAVVFRRRGDYDKALRLNSRALTFYRGSGARRNAAITLHGIALAEIELRQFVEAERHLTESLEICSDLGMHMDLARAWNTLGRVCLLAGRFDAGEKAHHAAITASSACGSRFEEAQARRGLGRIALATGDRRNAETHWRAALALLEEQGAPKADEVRADLAALHPDPSDQPPT